MNNPNLLEQPASANAGCVQRLVGLPVECERRYYANRESVPGDYDTAGFRQNMEVTGGDHWLAELNLDRWRNAEELAAYLRWAAASIEALAARKPNSMISPKSPAQRASPDHDE